MGILIAVDGVDASGKETQTNMLYQKLVNNGFKVRKISFPVYESPSSALVKMYLAGEFGENPDDVSAYVASSFFAADRFASYRTDWKNDYDNDTIILADRYVSSNMIHQASKITDENEKTKFLNWLFDLEYEIYKIPMPTVTIFLDMPTKYGMEFIKKRDNKIDKTTVKDIHERNTEYMQKSYDNAVYVSQKYNWNRVYCVKDEKVRTFEEINQEVYEIVRALI